MMMPAIHCLHSCMSGSLEACCDANLSKVHLHLLTACIAWLQHDSAVPSSAPKTSKTSLTSVPACCWCPAAFRLMCF
jgi:hypothetical protein